MFIPQYTDNFKIRKDRWLYLLKESLKSETVAEDELPFTLSVSEAGLTLYAFVLLFLSQLNPG